MFGKRLYLCSVKNKKTMTRNIANSLIISLNIILLWKRDRK